MVDCYISANSQYAYENEKYYKNGAVITNDTGNVVDEITFKSLIKKETSTFIHKSFSNIIVLVGAGASVLCNSGNIEKLQKIGPGFGKSPKTFYLCSALERHTCTLWANRIVLWCNGSTAVFGSACLGSNPGKTTF